MPKEAPPEFLSDQTIRLACMEYKFGKRSQKDCSRHNGHLNIPLAMNNRGILEAARLGSRARFDASRRSSWAQITIPLMRLPPPRTAAGAVSV